MNLRSEHVLSDTLGNINTFFNQSAFATYSLTDESNVVKVDKDMDLRILGPLGCGIGTGSGAVFDVLNPAAGSTIAIFGTGAVGFAAVMAAKIAGCGTIIAIDINESRLETALECGATHVINGSKEDAEAKIAEITNKKGVNYAIDTTGVNPVMKQALSALMNGGTFIPLAVTKKNFELNTFFELVFGNKKIQGVLIGDTKPKFHLPRLIDFYRKGMFPFDQFIKFFDFDEINEAEKASVTGEVIKPVVIIDKSYKPGGY
jgi:aryl-alcohol dehydrogenase